MMNIVQPGWTLLLITSRRAFNRRVQLAGLMMNSEIIAMCSLKFSTSLTAHAKHMTPCDLWWCQNQLSCCLLYIMIYIIYHDIYYISRYLLYIMTFIIYDVIYIIYHVIYYISYCVLPTCVFTQMAPHRNPLSDTGQLEAPHTPIH